MNTLWLPEGQLSFACLSGSNGKYSISVEYHEYIAIELLQTAVIAILTEWGWTPGSFDWPGSKRDGKLRFSAVSKNRPTIISFGQLDPNGKGRLEVRPFRRDTSYGRSIGLNLITIEQAPPGGWVNVAHLMAE